MKANGLKMVSIRLVDDPPIYSEDKIQNPNDAVQLLLKEFDSVDRELFFVLNLKTNGQVINVNIASMGTLNSCILSPREIFKASILSNAASVILMHNHPSGDCTPSKQDVLMTKRLVAWRTDWYHCVRPRYIRKGNLFKYEGGEYDARWEENI